MNEPRKTDALDMAVRLLRAYHAEVTQPLLARIAELEAQLKAQQRRLERGHCGTYARGVCYEAGDEVILNGSTYRAMVDDPSAAPPGDGWQMVCQGRKYPARSANLRAAA